MMQTEKRGAMQAILYGLFIGLTYALVGFNAFISLAALLLKLEYQLIHKLLWLACVCAVLTAALLFCCIGKKSASPFAGALPLYTVSAVLLFVGAGRQHNRYLLSPLRAHPSRLCRDHPPHQNIERRLDGSRRLHISMDRQSCISIQRQPWYH